MTLLDTILVPFYTLFPKLKRTLPSSKPLASLSISSTAIHLTPGAVLGQDDGEGQWPDHPEDFHIPLFDTGVFLNELANLHLLPQKLGHDADSDKSEAPTHPEQLLKEARTQAPAQLAEGTWRGTKLALTKIYDLIEKRCVEHVTTLSSSHPIISFPISHSLGPTLFMEVACSTFLLLHMLSVIVVVPTAWLSNASLLLTSLISA